MPDSSEFRCITGYLVVDPTDLTADYPHGGTELGFARDMVFKPNVKHRDIAAEEYGGAVIESIYVGESPVLACVFREWNADLLEVLFPYLPSTGVPAYEPGGSGVPGGKVSARACKLLFTPIDVDQDPHILLRKALPMVDASASINLHISKEFGLAAVFKGAPDSSGRCYAWGTRDKLTL